MSCLICPCNCWSHLESLQFIPWFISISSATWLFTDSEVPSYWDPWVIPGYWCEWQFRSWSCISNVGDKSLQTTIFVDPSFVGKNPLIQVRLPVLLRILKWEKTYCTTTKLSQQKSEVVFSIIISILKAVLYLWKIPKAFLNIIHSISNRLIWFSLIYHISGWYIANAGMNNGFSLRFVNSE